jgi:hypothetical protein
LLLFDTEGIVLINLVANRYKGQGAAAPALLGNVADHSLATRRLANEQGVVKTNAGAGKHASWVGDRWNKTTALRVTIAAKLGLRCPR